MPLRKRKATSTPATGDAKRVRVEVDSGEAGSDTAENQNPKRASTDGETTADPNVPRKRGRPAKHINSTSAVPAPIERAKRGRPPSDLAIHEAAAKRTKQEPVPMIPKKRGRPSLKTTSQIEESAAAKKSEPVKRGRGRPTKGTYTSKNHTIQPHNGPTIPIRRGRGRPLNARPAEILSISEDPGADDIDIEVTDEGRDGRQFWLMKAEPNDRFENGHNVKFSIDDLAAATEPEPWDGVRNYAARNNMRAMRKGDLAFFYHSNCAGPGIVGVMQIVKEHSIDESAFDPEHPYYDQKSTREAPKWDIVHVEYVKKLEHPLTLKMLKEIATTDGQLANMDVLRLKRLSVTAVTPYQWGKLLVIADEEPNLGLDGSANGHFRPSDKVEYRSEPDDFTSREKDLDKSSQVDAKASDKAENGHEGKNDQVKETNGVFGLDGSDGADGLEA